MRSEQETNAAIERYADTVWRLCVVNLHSAADAEDVFQTVFLRYWTHAPAFASAEHEKAWIIRVTLNACRDWRKWLFRHHAVSLDALGDMADELTEQHAEVVQAVRALPAKYRDVVYLHYYEGYTVPQIAQMLGQNANTVYTRLTRARGLLGDMLGGEADA